jgi:hypothetical protein
MASGLFVEEGAGDLGVGRLSEVNAKKAVVENFDHLDDGGTVGEWVSLRNPCRARLSPQTFAHIIFEVGWRHGRILQDDVKSGRVEVKLQGGTPLTLNEADLAVPGDRRVTDATELLANCSTESRRVARASLIGLWTLARDAC